MAFTPEQTKALEAPLSRANVKERTQSGRTLSYVEAWMAIAEANRIFGFDRWDRETVNLVQLGEPIMDAKGLYRVGYRAKVKVTVYTPDGDPTVREGCGFGSGIDRDLHQAHESALKEAESDAMKRALMTFGNPFGLALYDKKQEHVAEAERTAPKPPVFSGAVLAARAAIDLCVDEPALNKWGADNGEMIKSLGDADAALVRSHYGRRLMILRGEIKDAA